MQAAGLEKVLQTYTVPLSSVRQDLEKWKLAMEEEYVRGCGEGARRRPGQYPGPLLMVGIRLEWSFAGICSPL